MLAADETPRAFLPLAPDQIRRRRIAVVGGGLMGTATAYAAARLGGAGVTVDLYEAQQIGHEGAASKRAVEVAPAAAGCGVRFADGTSIEADVVVLAINGWLSDVLPEFPRLEITEQVMHYLVPSPAVAAEFEPARMPFCTWASNGIWAFPARNRAVKIGDNYPSRMLRHPTERSMPEPSLRERVLGLAVEQMPGLRDATLVQKRTCFYDYSPDGDFILDQWDANARLIVACGFSGHGFKFGPLIGQRLAQFALSGQRPGDLARFGLERLVADAE